MAVHREATRAQLRALAEFYRNLSVGLFLAFIVGAFAQGLTDLFQRASDLWFFGLLGLMFFLWSQRLLESLHE